VTVLIRKAYGMGGNAMGNPANVNIRLAWPSGEWSSIPVEGGVDAAYRREIASAPDPAAKRAELEAHLLAFRTPFSTAEVFALEELIDPRDTRPLLFEIIDAYRRNPGPPPGPKARSGVRP
jgi:acetyl-CoA carboxylase carboxyltransferase component